MKRVALLLPALLAPSLALAQAKPPTSTFEDLIIRKGADPTSAAGTLSRMLGERITASQTISNKLPGIATPARVGGALKDIAEFYSYGGKAEGCGLCATNPLSATTSVNGINTTGYTLAQWQAFYSVCADVKGRNPVTALTDELDEIALQCVINKKTQDGIVWVPSGILYQTKPIISGQYALTVRGVGGRDATTIIQTVRGQDAWHHGTSDTGWRTASDLPIYQSRLALHGITFGCGGPGTPGNDFVCGTAIRADFDTGTAGFTLEDIAISARGNQTTNYWHDGVKCNNCSLTEIARATIGGINTGAGLGSLLSTGTALEFTGKGAVQFSIRDTTTNGWNRAVAMTVGNKDNTTTFGNQEGFVFDNWQANQVMDALTTINYAGDGHESPQLVVTNSQFNVCRRLFYVAQMAEIFINNNLVYGCTSGIQTGGTADYTQFAGAVTGATTAGSAVVTLTASTPAGIVPGVPFFGPGVPSNTTVSAVSGASVTLTKPVQFTNASKSFAYGKGSAGFDAVEYMVFNGTSRGNLTANTFNMGDKANISTLGWFLNSKDWFIQDNKLQLVFTQSLSTLFFNDSGNQRIKERDSYVIGPGSDFTMVAGGTNGAANGVRFESFYKQFGTSVRSDGSLIYENNQVVNLDANKNAQLYVPPTFTATPKAVQITNGDVTANGLFCGLNMANTSATAVGINCPAGTNGAPVRIMYTLTGDR